jgi:hypothetical protein
VPTAPALIRAEPARTTDLYLRDLLTTLRAHQPSSVVREFHSSLEVCATLAWGHGGGLASRRVPSPACVSYPNIDDTGRCVSPQFWFVLQSEVGGLLEDEHAGPR